MRRSEPDVCIEFTHSSAAAGSVRRALARDLVVTAPLADDVALVVSELVTNVVRHAGTDGVVELWARSDEVRIEVHNGASAVPQMRATAGPDGGFGLRIVDRLATAWGHRVSRHGKTVWAVFRESPSTTP
jgi:anti-sigma regulatory factor (Ser/Thr protein kinase)